jgi:hypothetical protein
MFDYITLLATKLMTDLTDPEALVKLRREREALDQYLATGDRPEAILKSSDIVFFAALAYKNCLLSFDEAMVEVAFAARALGLTLSEAFQIAEAKYALRASRPGQPIDEQAEWLIANYWYR